MRNRHLGVLCAVAFFLFCAYSLSKRAPDGLRPPLQHPQGPVQAPKQPDGSSSTSTSKTKSLVSEKTAWVTQDFPATTPRPAPAGSHPIQYLITDASREFDAVKARQSRTLHDAAAEYRRRYGLPPPPHFDKWWAFAKDKKVQLVDEFDTIHHQLTPFWGLKPATIRARAREALGFDNQLMGLQVRNGNVTVVFGGAEWMQEALVGMMQGFVEHLPDMDLAFNVNDESRVVVPHDDMARLVHTARTVAMPAANAATSLRNAFTPNPAGLNHHGRFDEVGQTRFDFFAHQPIWTHSRMSCPPSSPARILEEPDQYDDVAAYALGELGFVHNWTAMSDICLSPSLASTYGFFERPNAYGVVHDLFPIFSQSKISSYSDIIYPSPWYWADKVPYTPSADLPWSEKHNRLYWRGSTTGGFSRNGGWRRQHRQRLVRKLNSPDTTKILTQSPPVSSEWKVTTTPKKTFQSHLDVSFSHIGQCDESDCDAQRAFFSVKEYAPQEDAMLHKHVLDMDGNAFSGRFYALLRSKSLVYKWAIFREWHAEWLRPWVHFVPLSLRGEEWVEVVRFFAAEKGGDGSVGKEEVVGKEGEEKKVGLGEELAGRLAEGGREWAGRVLRNEDLEVWFFRLLLEYGRLVDDDREKIGYAG